MVNIKKELNSGTYIYVGETIRGKQFSIGVFSRNFNDPLGHSTGVATSDRVCDELGKCIDEYTQKINQEIERLKGIRTQLDSSYKEALKEFREQLVKN